MANKDVPDYDILFTLIVSKVLSKFLLTYQEAPEQGIKGFYSFFPTFVSVKFNLIDNVPLHTIFRAKASEKVSLVFKIYFFGLDVSSKLILCGFFFF